MITSELLTPITCTGAANGAIEILASGGTDPMKYTLNPGGITNAAGRFGLLAPGTYTVEVSDVEGCGPVTSSLFSLTDPPVFLLDSVTSDGYHMQRGKQRNHRHLCERRNSSL